MSRRWCIPGVVFLLISTVLLAIASVSVPYFTAMDISRTHFKGTTAAGSQNSVSQLRTGVWGYCTYGVDTDVRDCHHDGVGYKFTVAGQNGQNQEQVNIGSSWTRGLVLLPIAAVATFLAFLLSLSTHTTVTLLASLMSFLAALITLIAFAIEIALYAWVKHEINKLNNVDANTNTAPAFWLTFVSMILTTLAGCTVCFGRRRERMYGATTYPSTYPMSETTTKPGFFSRFRRRA